MLSPALSKSDIIVCSKLITFALTSALSLNHVAEMKRHLLYIWSRALVTHTMRGYSGLVFLFGAFLWHGLVQLVLLKKKNP